ncbi:MAG: thioesterase family protein [Bacteroidota bacterium]
MKINHISTTQLRVRYGETDQMGYCYYGNYAQYLEVGRVEALRLLGMSYKEMEAQGFMLPVSEFSIKYHAPAKYDDLLTITTKIVSLEGVRLLFNYEIINELEQKICSAATTLVFVNKTTMRPINPPDNFKTIIAPLAYK